MTPLQMKMARTALGWGVRDLAEKAGITANTVTRIENGADAKHSTLTAIRLTLESAGIQFLESGEVAIGPGVALKGVREEGLRPEQLSAENDG